jgi:hypothetical protein
MTSSECGLRRRSRRLVCQPNPSSHEQRRLRLCAHSQPARTGLKDHSRLPEEVLPMPDPFPPTLSPVSDPTPPPLWRRR